MPQRPSGHCCGFTVVPGTHLQFFRPNVTTAPSQIEVAGTSSVPINGNWQVNGIIYCAR
jgi:hypothetical protein